MQGRRSLLANSGASKVRKCLKSNAHWAHSHTFPQREKETSSCLVQLRNQPSSGLSCYLLALSQHQLPRDLIL